MVYGYNYYQYGNDVVKTATEIVGIEQLENVLNGLPKRLNKKLLGQATRAVAKFTLQDARANVQPYSKFAPKQVKVWALTRSRRAGVWVGWNIKQARKDFKEHQSDRSKAMWAFMSAVWLEYGSTGIGRSGKFRGIKYRALQPVGWFRRAVDTNIGRTEKEFKGILHKKINTFLDKWITKHGW